MLKFNKHPALNKCPGKKIFPYFKCSEKKLPKKSSNNVDIIMILIELITFFKKLISVLSLIRDVLGGKVSEKNKNVLDYY